MIEKIKILIFGLLATFNTFPVYTMGVDNVGFLGLEVLYALFASYGPERYP